MSSIILNGFRDRHIWIMCICVKRQLAVVPVDSDIVGVLWKITHIFTNAEFGDMMYVYGFCDGSATAAVEYRQRFPMRRIPDRKVFYVFNTLRECGTLPSAHVSSERARKQNMEEHENILDMAQRSPTATLEDFQHVSVFHEHVYGEHCMETACTHFNHSLCKIYTQGTVPCV